MVVGARHEGQEKAGNAFCGMGGEYKRKRLEDEENRKLDHEEQDHCIILYVHFAQSLHGNRPT
jgi:hypothetical protein